jgi:hypothetical protein
LNVGTLRGTSLRDGNDPAILANDVSLESARGKDDGPIIDCEPQWKPPFPVPKKALLELAARSICSRGDPSAEYPFCKNLKVKVFFALEDDAVTMSKIGPSRIVPLRPGTDRQLEVGSVSREGFE